MNHNSGIEALKAQPSRKVMSSGVEKLGISRPAEPELFLGKARRATSLSSLIKTLNMALKYRHFLV